MSWGQIEWNHKGLRGFYFSVQEMLSHSSFLSGGNHVYVLSA